MRPLKGIASWSHFLAGIFCQDGQAFFDFLLASAELDHIIGLTEHNILCVQQNTLSRGVAKNSGENMDSKWFAGRLRELRQQAGLTQQQLADNAKMTRDGIAQIETGKNSPSWETVVVLCQALGVDCTEFTKEPTDKKKPGPGRPPKVQEEAEKPAAKGKRKGKGE